METALKHQIITLEDCGPVSVFMQVSIKVPGLRPSTQGDERRLRDGVVFLTVHDVGCTYQVLGGRLTSLPRPGSTFQAIFSLATGVLKIYQPIICTTSKW